MTTTTKREPADPATVEYMSDLIEQHLKHCRLRGFAQATTITDRGEILRRLDTDLPMGLGMATTEELEDWLVQHEASSRSTYMSHILGFFRWAADPNRPKIDYDPTAGMQRPRVGRRLPKPVTDEEVEFAVTTLGAPWRTYVLLAAYEGARCAEIATIERSAITKQETRITGKGGRTRVVATHADVWAAVQDFPPGRIARKVTTGGPVTPGYISAVMEKQFTKLGMPDVSMHRFRHWFATKQLRPKEFGGAGLSVRAVQENLGHEQLASTAMYTLVIPEERAAGIHALPSFTRPAT